MTEEVRRKETHTRALQLYICTTRVLTRAGPNMRLNSFRHTYT
jgi:hypothetical protein